MAPPASGSPIGQIVTLDDGRRAWIRVPRSATGVEPVGHHWRREVVDGKGRRIAAASYEAHAPGMAHASVWVAPAWRSAGLGTRLCSMLTEAAAGHGARWLTFHFASGDAAARRLLAGSGWIVARRVRGDDARVAVWLSPDPRLHAGLDAGRAGARAA